MPLRLILASLVLCLLSLACQTAPTPPTPRADIPATVETLISEDLAIPDSTPTPFPTPTTMPTMPTNPLTPTSTATPIPRPSQTASPTQAYFGFAVLSQGELEREKTKILEEVNQWRAKAGLPDMTMGQNPTPQVFADQSLSNCSGGIWGMDGLNPYVRYALTGGYQDSTELHLFSAPFCIQPLDTDYAPAPSLDLVLRDFIETGPEDSRQRKPILNPSFRRVSIGLAVGQDRVNYRLVLLFERDVIQYLSLPSLQEGQLVLRGRLKHQARFTRPEFIVQVNYDLPPYPVNQGQIAWSRVCYSRGPIITVIRPPLPLGSYYPSEEGFGPFHACPAPYEFPVDIPAPTNLADMEDLKEQLTYLDVQTLQIPYIFVVADRMGLTDNELFVRANISHLLEEYGPGVYTASVLGEVDGVEIPISRVAFFVGFDPPETHGQGYMKP